MYLPSQSRGGSQKIRSKHRKGIIGSMRHPMTLIFPKLVAPQDVEKYDYFIEKYQEIVVWGDIETKVGSAIFDSANTVQTFTDVFRIRYREELTKEWKIRVYGDIYTILQVINFEKRKEFLELKCCIMAREANVTGKAEFLPSDFQ